MNHKSVDKDVSAETLSVPSVFMSFFFSIFRKVSVERLDTVSYVVIFVFSLVLNLYIRCFV